MIPFSCLVACRMLIFLPLLASDVCSTPPGVQGIEFLIFELGYILNEILLNLIKSLLNLF